MPASSPSLLSRRRFLRHAAGSSLAAPFILPAMARGAEGRPAPSNRIAIGFIGTGRQATHANLPGFLREADAQVVALCDVDAWRLDEARKQVEAHYAKATPAGTFKGVAVTRDWRELVARTDLDAVMISTPDHWHVIMAVAAIRAGKDVACEKPLTRSIHEGRTLADLAADRKRVFRTDSEFRSLRAMHRAVEIVRNGRIGKLKHVLTGTPKDSSLPPQPDQPVPPELDYDMWLGPAPAAPYTEKRVHPRHDTRGRPGWITIRDYADGMLANWGAHLNDIALWGMNADRTGPVAVEGTGKQAPPGSFWNVIQEFEVHFDFADGVRLTCRTDEPYVRFEGSEGWIEVRYPNDIRASHDALLAWKPGPNDVALPYKISEKRDFLDCVKSRERTQADAEAGHRNTSLCHLALAAIDVGRRVSWDPAKETSTEAEANRRLAPKPYRGSWKL
jgi:myo-inositol 2-dehydrogenase / D-chiro-inositol 1-dehydrogenase